MKKELKLGMAVSAVIVTVAGGYYLFKGKPEEPVPVGTSAASGKDASKVADPRSAARPKSNAAQPASAPPSNSPAGDRTARRERPANPNARPTQPADPNSAKPAGTAAPSAANPGGNPRPAAPATHTPEQTAMANSATKPRVPESNAAVTAPSATSSVPDQPASKTPETPAGPAPASATDVAANPAAGGPAGSAPAADAANSRTATAIPTPGFVTKPEQPQGGAPSSSSTASSGLPRTAPNPAPPTSSSNPAGTTRSQTESHRVQPGDSFASLAQTYYGNSKYASVLAEANPEFKEPSRLPVGSIVKIPPKPAQPPAEPVRLASATNASERPASGARTYKVQAGDSFYSIARKELGDANRWKELFALNKELVRGDATNLQIGQVVRLPER